MKTPLKRYLIKMIDVFKWIVFEFKRYINIFTGKVKMRLQPNFKTKILSVNERLMMDQNIIMILLLLMMMIIHVMMIIIVLIIMII